ncbi:MAG: branched-chain amino acid ABC transporter permease [Nitrososphaerales archaeon]
MVNIENFIIDMFIYVGIFGILSISLNLEYGFTGLWNFGKVAFYMIGAYTSAIVTTLGQPFYVGFAAGVVVSGLAGLLISLPALRLREDYLGILTLVFGEIIRIILKNEYWLGGPLGIRGIPSITTSGLSYTTALLIQLASIGVIAALCYLVAHRLIHSPYGRVMRGIREDELATASLGKNTFRYKASIFAISSAMAGIAGAFMGQYVTSITPDQFMPFVSFTVWMMVMLGGFANIEGAFLGAFLYIGFERAARIAKDYLLLPIDPNNLMFILTGLLILIFVFFRPQGLLKENKVRDYKGV